MEFVPGGELFDYIVSRGRLPAEEARHFFHQVFYFILFCAMPYEKWYILHTVFHIRLFPALNTVTIIKLYIEI